MFEYTEEDRKKALSGYFIQDNPLKLREMPAKQKRKYIVLTFIVEAFEEDRHYTEKEVNVILEKIYPDYVELRRALVDYGLMDREMDCSDYWVNKKRLD